MPSSFGVFRRGARYVQRTQLPSTRSLCLLYLIAGLSAGAISLSFEQSKNFHVFGDAARALVRGDDLYVLRSLDYFKYSPTFALAFLPFALAPASIGAPLWSLANFALAFAGIERVLDTDWQKRVALSIALTGILLVTDGDQSNLLVAGAMLLALDAFERGLASTGAALVVGAGFIKIFPFAAAAFVVFSPRKWRGALYLFVMVIALAAMPLLVCTPRTLLAEYASWRHLLAWDYGNHGWSMMTVVQDGLHLPLPSVVIQVTATVVQAVPLVLGARFGTDARWRRTFACTLFCFFVLFNHRTEYTSFVLSAIAVAIWFATTLTSPAKTALVALVLLAPGPFFASPDDSVPGLFSFVAAHRTFHSLRVVPLFFAWVWMICDLFCRLALFKGSLPLNPEMRDAHAR
jgi:hypothetical protein